MEEETKMGELAASCETKRLNVINIKHYEKLKMYCLIIFRLVSTRISHWRQI